ncbi:MAG TPA: hypothetical protein VMF30_12770, partial [Pirellulales bacterium]|nr:hypothetical protein [Pirellulales bacterium]
MRYALLFLMSSLLGGAGYWAWTSQQNPAGQNNPNENANPQAGGTAANNASPANNAPGANPAGGNPSGSSGGTMGGRNLAAAEAGKGAGNPAQNR